MPPPTAIEVGIWIACLAGLALLVATVLTIINQWRKLTTPPQPPAGKELVTREELTSVELRLKQDIQRVDASVCQDIDRVDRETKSKLDELNTSLRLNIERVDRDTKGRLEELTKYCQGRFHEIANVMHGLGLQMANMPVEFQKMINQALVPLGNKTDRNAVMLAELAVLVRGRRVPEDNEEHQS